MKKEELEKLRAKLLAEKNELERELRSFAKKDPVLKGDWDTSFPQMEERAAHQEEDADEVEEYEKLLDVEYNFETRLKEIDEALTRMESDAYGICTKCGKALPAERLEANPAASTCLKC